MSQSYPCAGCNADLKWSPGDGQLVCPYCGTANDLGGTEQSQVVEEEDLGSMLAAAPVGWSAEVSEFKCGQCGAFTTVEPHVTVSSCAFCGTTQLDLQPQEGEVLQPKSLLPFAVERSMARRGFGAWVKSLWFRPSDLKRMARLDALKGVYIPVFTFDMKTRTPWTATAGHHYYVNVPDGKGGTRRERRTRWVPASGTIRRDFDDWMVPATSGLSHELFKGLLPYDTSALVPYDSRYLAGFVAERYQINLETAWDTGRSEMAGVIHSLVVSDIPGDTYRNLDYDIRAWDKTFKHCLVPVWIAAYRYKDKVYRYLVNGVTGARHGTAPYSWVKITGAVLAVAGLVGALVWWIDKA